MARIEPPARSSSELNLFEWRDVFFEYVGFLSSFWILGAIGFRYGVLRVQRGTSGNASTSLVATAFRSSEASAAGVGLIGAVLGVVTLVQGLLKRADAKHQTLGDAFDAGGATSLAQVVLLAILLVAFALAWRRVVAAWPVAGAAGIAFALRSLLRVNSREWWNPLQRRRVALAPGTLFVLVVCGIGQMLRPSVPAAGARADRGRAGTALLDRGPRERGPPGRHRLDHELDAPKPLSALWTTPYGYALIAKLSVVAVVIGLGVELAARRGRRSEAKGAPSRFVAPP